MGCNAKNWHLTLVQMYRQRQEIRNDKTSLFIGFESMLTTRTDHNAVTSDHFTRVVRHGDFDAALQRQNQLMVVFMSVALQLLGVRANAQAVFHRFISIETKGAVYPWHH